MLAAAAAAYAQEPQDSTVYIIARWQAGDKYAYEYSSKECKTANGDTTEFAYSNAILTYEILEETETSYKASVTYKDEFSSNQLNNMLNDLLAERYGDPKIIFTTDQYGTLQSIDNIQELSDQIVSIIDDMVKILINVNEETPMEQVDMLKEQLKTMFSNHDTIMQIFAEDIGRVLYFHGCGMKLDQEYTGQIQVPSIYPGVDQLFPADVTIWADSEFTDEYSTVCRSYTTVSNEEFKNVIGKTVINNLKSAVIPDLANVAAEANLVCLILSGDEPHATAGEPVIRHFYLLTVDNSLLEETVLVAEGVACCGIVESGERVDKASGKTAETTVTKTCIGLTIINAVKLDAVILKHACKRACKIKVEKCIFK